MIDKRRYQRLVGRVIYLSHSRSNTTYIVGVVSQFMHDPREEHMHAVFRILHYLKASPRKGILLKKGTKLIIEAYTDVDHARSLIDRRSTLGYCTFLGGNLITWRSKK